MAASETVIGNAALFKLGEKPVLTFDDENDRARVLKARFDAVRDDELRAHRWTFATKRASLSALASTPAWGFELEYSIPSDCLQLMEVSGADVSFSLPDNVAAGQAMFALEDGKILTDLSAPLPVRYVYRVTSTVKFDPCFDEALACRLAMELAEPLTQSGSKKQDAARQYGQALTRARRMNAIERPPQALGDDSWVLARR